MEFYIGQRASVSKTISESDVYLFAGICGDFNSVHINEIEASKSRFGKKIVHGALLNSFFSTVLGMKLPGEGTIYISQNTNFLAPVYQGDTITAGVEIVEISNNKATLKTQIINQDGVVVVDGEAKVLLPPV